MTRIWSQSLKELKQFLRDRLTVLLAIALPVLSLLLYGFATRLEMKNIPLAVENFDNSLVSRSFIERLFSNQQFLPASWPGGNPIKNALDPGLSEAAVIIPPEFDRRLRSGMVSPVAVLIDGTDVNNARVIKNSILSTTNAFLDSYGLNQAQPLIKPELRIWFNPGRKESLYIVPGAFGIILWIWPSLLAAIAMAREREQGTILQAYASSLTAFELIAGKVIAYLLVGIVITLIIVALGILIFSIPLAGDPLLFAFGTLLYIVDAVTFGLLIGAGVTSQSAAVQGVAFGGFTTALLLSGYIYPIRNIAFPLSLLTNIVPAAYYIELSRDTFVRGSGWSGQWHVPLVLLLFGVVFFFLSVKRLGRMQISD